MNSSRQTEPFVIKPCCNCNGQLPAPDDFCRWCGAHQFKDSVSVARKALWGQQTTKLLRNEEGRYQSPSSLLLITLEQNVLAKTGSLRLNRFGVLVIAVLIAIPMWLVVILLSPLDAYISVRAVSSQINIQ